MQRIVVVLIQPICKQNCTRKTVVVIRKKEREPAFEKETVMTKGKTMLAFIFGVSVVNFL